MKAMRIRQPASLDAIEPGTCEAAAPGPGEVRVAVRAASLNFRDGLIVNGVFPARDGLIPLSDGAGEVTDVGAGVSEFSPGDRVVSTFHPNWLDGHIERARLDNSPGGPADGFACEAVTRPATHFTRAPADFTHAEAASLTCAGVTAWRALVTDGQVRPGAWVMVQGTGGVSLFALQIARAAGARVIATSASAAKRARLTSLGAEHVIDYAADPEWSRTVLDLTGGAGLDHVVEVGGPTTLAQSFAAVRTGGHVALIGAVGGFQVDTMPFAVVQAKRLRIQGVTVGSRRDQQDLVRAIDANGIRPVIDTTFSLDNIADAYRHMFAGGHFGKICIGIGE